MNSDIVEQQIKRALEVFGCKNQSNLAALLGISDTNFSNRKKRGTLLKLIEVESYRSSVDFHYILTGELSQPGETIHKPPESRKIPDPRAPADPGQERGEDHYIVQAMRLTSEVMTSRHHEIKLALMKNLEQFAEAVNKADELESCKIQLREQEKEIRAMKEEISNLKAKEEISNLKTEEEISNLKAKLDELLRREPHGASAAPGDSGPVLDEKAM